MLNNLVAWGSTGIRSVLMSDGVRLRDLGAQTLTYAINRNKLGLRCFIQTSKEYSRELDRLKQDSDSLG